MKDVSFVYDGKSIPEIAAEQMREEMRRAWRGQAPAEVVKNDMERMVLAK